MSTLKVLVAPRSFNRNLARNSVCASVSTDTWPPIFFISPSAVQIGSWEVLTLSHRLAGYKIWEFSAEAKDIQKVPVHTDLI